MNRTLGTQLRHLIDLLDGAVEAAYHEAGLEYRPRYTPVMRALLAGEPLTLGQIAERTGITQPAATQTITLMIKEGWVQAERGVTDGRQKMISLTPHARKAVPLLAQCWQATNAAAAGLDTELPHSLSDLLAATIEALAQKPFGVRIAERRVALSNLHPKKDQE